MHLLSLFLAFFPTIQENYALKDPPWKNSVAIGGGAGGRFRGQHKPHGSHALSLTGRVFDLESLPVPKAMVEARCSNTLFPDCTQSAVSNSNGEFTVTGPWQEDVRFIVREIQDRDFVDHHIGQTPYYWNSPSKDSLKSRDIQLTLELYSRPLSLIQEHDNGLRAPLPFLFRRRDSFRGLTAEKLRNRLTSSGSSGTVRGLRRNEYDLYAQLPALGWYYLGEYPIPDLLGEHKIHLPQPVSWNPEIRLDGVSYQVQSSEFYFQQGRLFKKFNLPCVIPEGHYKVAWNNPYLRLDSSLDLRPDRPQSFSLVKRGAAYLRWPAALDKFRSRKYSDSARLRVFDANNNRVLDYACRPGPNGWNLQQLKPGSYTVCLGLFYEYQPSKHFASYRLEGPTTVWQSQLVVHPFHTTIGTWKICSQVENEQMSPLFKKAPIEEIQPLEYAWSEHSYSH